jgi:hypothetical protein
MTKQPYAFLFLCLFATLLLVTTATSDADGPTASPRPLADLPLADLLIFRSFNLSTFQFSNFSTFQPSNLLTIHLSPLPTPTPSPVLSAVEGPTPACNRPASDMPPRPDGCYGGEFPVAPPPQPIPPPCIAAWTVEEWVEDGQPVTELLVTVEHPELQSYAPRGWVHLANYGDAWQLVVVDAQVSCGKDEAPLAWATLQILNGGDVDAALAIYTSPLPPGYLDALTPLTSEHNTRGRIYLPLVSRGDSPPLQAHSHHHQSADGATVDRQASKERHP